LIPDLYFLDPFSEDVLASKIEGTTEEPDSKRFQDHLFSIVVSSLRIVADVNIPCVDEAFGTLGTIERVPGREIEAGHVRTADVMLVRSVTTVGPSLLEGSAVQFVGSATIGTDHVDRDYLASQGIAFAHAPASNADSVADYVVTALLWLAARRGAPLEEKTVGIVGCGNIGGRLARRLPALGATVLQNDPPRAEAARAAGRAHDFRPLPAVLDAADILTCHVPWTREGSHPTHHLIGEEELAALRPGAWVVNTSRGPVVDNAALRAARTDGPVGAAVLDVWEGEPRPDPALVSAADVATPHIAGYAYDGKVRGTTMLYEALCEHLGVEPSWSPAAALRPATPGTLRCPGPDPRLPRADWLSHLARQAYDLPADDARMRGYLTQPPEDQGAYFRRLRATYPTRRELQQQTVARSAVPARYRTAVTEGLTLRCPSLPAD
jgi:erythronate-4-phosphate dehydrogenase